MADRKISDLTALTTPAAGDYLPIVDISEVAASSKNKRITIEELLRGAPDGTAAAPSIGFESDPNTGIYRPGADQLAISTNGTGRLFVDASGNVGVGAAPSNTFDVTAASNPTASIRATAAATSTSILKLEGYRTSGDTGRLGEISVINTRDGDEQASIEITADGDTEGKFTFKSSTNSLCELGNSFTRFFSSNTERLRITSAGLVGIGTSSPDNKLSVGIASADEGIELKATYNGARVARFGLLNPGVDNTPYIGSVAGNDFGFITSNSRRMTITAGGSVGIGTTSPSNTLHVAGIARIANSAGGELLLEDSDEADGNRPFQRIVSDSGSLVFLNANRSGTGTTGSTERARIDSSGRLLVGTSSARTDIGSNQTAVVQAESTVNGLGFFTAYNQNNAFGSVLAVAKSRGTTVGSNTIVQSGDQIGGVYFYGADGVDTAVAGSIDCYVDGTPGANDMPGRLVFSTTADGASSPTERMRITSTGQVRLAGAGITFNGDTATANELDDYEEGTWTPSFLGSTTNPTQDYNLRFGRYVKIGRSVFVTCRLLMVNTGISGGTGDLFVGNLPFVSANVAGQFWGIAVSGSTLSTAATGGFILNNESAILLLASNSLATFVPASVVTNNSSIVITGWYEV